MQMRSTKTRKWRKSLKYWTKWTNRTNFYSQRWKIYRWTCLANYWSRLTKRNLSTADTRLRTGTINRKNGSTEVYRWRAKEQSNDVKAQTGSKYTTRFTARLTYWTYLSTTTRNQRRTTTIRHRQIRTRKVSLKSTSLSNPKINEPTNQKNKLK